MSSDTGPRGLEVKVGILVTVCVGLLVAFILLLGGISVTPGSTLHIDVDTSAAVKAGAPVKVAGVSAGKVTDVEYRGGAIDEAVGRPVFVRVTLRIDDDKLATLREGARFYITTQGVLGEKYVEIEPQQGEGKTLKDGDVVVGEPPLRLDIMAMNANRVLSSLAEMLRKNEARINSIIANADDTMSVVKRAVGRVDTILAANGGKVDVVVDQLLSIEAEVKTLAVSANHALGDGSELRAAVRNASQLTRTLNTAVEPVVADVRSTLERYRNLADVGASFVSEARQTAGAAISSVDAILADIKVVTGKIRDGEGTIGALLADKEMYDDIREMMKDLKRHPWKFIWKE